LKARLAEHIKKKFKHLVEADEIELMADPELISIRKEAQAKGHEI